MNEISFFAEEIGYPDPHIVACLLDKICFSPNWEKIVRFLNETDHDFAYWSIDGYTRSEQETAHI